MDPYYVKTADKNPFLHCHNSNVNLVTHLTLSSSGKVFFKTK